MTLDSLGPPLLLPLNSPDGTIEVVGGKGASLASISAANFPVPDGFHVTTHAYRQFMAKNGLDREVARALGQSGQTPAGLSGSALSELRRAIEAGTLEQELIDELRVAYASLGGDDHSVAVRSSATAEDLPEASFAGQQDTFLHVRDMDAVLTAITRCWASLWTERAVHYRDRLHIDHGAVGMGVVVQKMVAADLSGVMFTANPTTGERGELLINASFGLGEAVVSGQVTPDSYTIRTSDLAITAVRIGEKSVKIVPGESTGTVQENVDLADRSRRALTDTQLQDLATLGLRLQEHFDDVPQDVEWAIGQGSLWLLQSRPITGLPPQPLREVTWEPPIAGSKWIRRQIVEHMPGPLSPLFDELYLQQGLERSTDRVMELLELDDTLEDFMDRPLFATVNGFAYMRADTHLGWQVLGPYFRAMTRGLPALFRKSEPFWREEAVPEYTAEVERWKRLGPAACSDALLLDGIRAIAWADARYWFSAALVIGQAKVTDSLLDSFLVSLTPGSGLHSGQFLRGLHSKTLDSEEELESLADLIRGSESLHGLVGDVPAEHLLATLEAQPEAQALVIGLHAYLERYGHQIYSLDFAEPTQIDDPLPVLVTLKAMAQQPRVDTAARRADIIRTRNELARRTARSLDPIRRRMFRRLLRWAWVFAPNREAALFYVGYGWPTLRRLALELGKRLAESGALTAADDVFYLESSELSGAIAARARDESRPDLARTARERRELRSSRMRLHPPAAVPPEYVFHIGAIDLSGRETQRRNDTTGPVINGFAVSPGRVTAPASVILSPAEFGAMQPGSILVCPITTPAWTPLFSRALGLVTDIGGVLAHGSIVAREYGIPAVMGTGVATQRIASGQTITVDGDAGTVEIRATGTE